MRRKFLLLLAAIAVPAAAYAGFRVSSFKKETNRNLGADYWNAASAIDNKLDTCWMVDSESNNVGEWFEIDLPKSTVDKLSMDIGWQKSDETFTDYPRVKTAKVEIFGSAADENAKVAEATVSFEDKQGMQTVELPDTPIGSDIYGGKVRITVMEVYPGVDYPNLAVSEVLIKLKNEDVIPSGVKLTAPPTSVLTGHAPDLMLDADPKTYFASNGPGEVTFDVKADGFGVSEVGIVPGPLSSARPKTIDVSINGHSSTCTLDDKPVVAWCELPSLIGYTGSSWGAVTVTVTDTYPGKTDQNVGIAEVKLHDTNYEAL